MVQWCFVVGEDRCIHMTQDGKDLGRVADVKVADQTKCLIAIKLFNERKPQAVRLDRFQCNANDLTKKIPVSSPASFVNFFVQRVKVHIDITTGVYNPLNENAQDSVCPAQLLPNSSMRETPTQPLRPLQVTLPPARNTSRKRSSVSVPENGRRKVQKVTTSEDGEDDLEEALQRHFEGQFCLPIRCMTAPSHQHTVRPIDEVFVQHLKKEMVENPTTDVAPLIGLLVLPEGETFDKLNPDSYMYETLGGNNSRTALDELCRERPELASDQRFSSRMVSVYTNLSAQEAQYLAVKHNRQQSFVHQMTTQDKVHVCRMKLMSLANGEPSTGDQQSVPEPTTKWRDDCSRTLMTTKLQLINNMILSLASLPSPTYELLLKIFRKYEKEKKQTGRPTKPDCRGANFRELRNLDDKAVHNLLQKVEAEEMPLSSLNAECKRLKKMRKLKESFVSEVGASSWEEASTSFPNFATEQNLERYFSSSKLSGPVLAAFHQFCRRAITSQVPVTPGNNSQSVSQVLTQIVEGKEYHSVHMKLPAADLTYGDIADILPQTPGFSLILGSFCGRSPNEVEQLLRAFHAINRGAGVGGFVIIAECAPQGIGMYADLLKKHEFDTELLYWKQMTGSDHKEAHTLLKEVISPFIIGTLNREFVRAHLAIDGSLQNIKEGTREALLEELVTTFSLKDDWIMEFDPSSCADSISSVAKKLKRNTLLIGSEEFLLVDDTCDDKRRSSEGENEEENDDEVEATEDLEN